MTELIQRLKRSDLFERYSLSAFLVVTLTLLMCLLAVSSANAQGGLACDNLVNVSLTGSDCQHDITAAIILEANNITESDYTVTVRDQNGATITGSPTVTSTNVGDLLQVKVEHMTTGESCWGNIKIELKPVFENCRGGVIIPSDLNSDNVSIRLSCGQLDSLERLPTPTLLGNCSTVKLDTSFTDEYTSQCHSNEYIDLITRTWIMTDPSGKEGTCDQIIGILRPSLTSVIWPPHYDSDTLITSDDAIYGDHRMRLSCDFLVDTSGVIYNVGNTIFNPDGSPSPETTGYPSDISCRNVQYTYKDVFIPLCGNGFKVLREWNLLDWCNGSVIKYHQIIKLVDDRGPIATCPTDDIIVNTDPWACLGTLNPVPDPIQIFDCSATTYTVAYKLRDVNGDPFENPITDNVIDNGNGTYGISNLPLDTTWLVYTITDACGFSTQCFTEIVVEDHDPPNAICEKHTVVSLDHNGTAKAPAAVFDDHSYDNCGVVRFQARKQDETIYQDTVKFDCSDMGLDGVKIVMRAYDATGSFGECWITAKVQNKLVNVLESCPQPATVNCDESTDPAVTGRPVLDESCITATMEYEDVDFLKCGEGKIVRSWTITDFQGEVQTCLQEITVADVNPFSEFDIKWPVSLEIDGCALSGVDPDQTGRPEFVNLDCVELSVGYEDEYFELLDGCKKIIREWTIIDWCRYDADFPLSRTRWSYFQSIKISNSQGPTFVSGCDTLDLNTEDCTLSVTLTSEATDDCTGKDDLDYRWELDVDYNGTFVRSNSGTGATETRDFAVGTHAIKWYVVDECGNVETCTQVFHINDTSIPSFSCLGSLSLSLTSDGWTDIWASDFVKDVTGKCNGFDSSNITFSFEETVMEANKKIDCAHFYDYAAGNGVTYLEELKIYILNNDKVVDFCTVSLRVTDNFDTCPDFGASSASISGKITTENNEGLSDFDVMLKSMMDDTEIMSQTSTTGEYAFSGVGLYDDYVINPEVNDMAVNGVSTLDIVLMQKHILGLKLLDSPYKEIAADINNSGTISATDLVVARKLILGIIEEFPNSNSWRFIDASHDLATDNGMNSYPEYIDVLNILENEEEANFIGVKVGDVNESVQLSLNATEVRSRNSVSFEIDDIEFEAGQEYLVPVIIKDESTKSINGLQLDIEYNDRVVEILGVSAGDLDLNKQNYIIQDGSIKLSWNSFETVKLSDNGALFFINIKTKTKNQFSNIFEVREDDLASEFIDENLEAKSVELTFRGDGLVSKDFTLYQNKPNPFSDRTTVSFDLPEASEISFKVFDTKGQLIMQSEQYFNQGFNEFELNFEGLDHTGILYLNMAAGKYSANTKMVLIK